MEQHKRAIKKIVKSKSFIGLTVLIIFLVSYFFIQKYYQNYKLRIEIGHMLEEAKKVENSNAELRALLQKVKSPEYAEQIARTNFNMVKPGETQVVVVGGTGKKGGQAKKDMLESIRISNPHEWWNYFFNHNN